MAPSFLLTAIYFLRAVTWMLAMVILGLLGTAIEVLTFPVFYFLDPTLRVYQYLVCLIAQASLYPVISVKVHGEENLPKGACIIVSNHGSFLDPSLCAVALHSVNFKCTFKHDLMFIPGIGSSLWLAGHIPVNRKLKEGGLWSCKDAMTASRTWAERGVALLTFAEGTRTTSTEQDGSRLGEFKPGPFVTAQRAQVPIVPMTLSGARSLFPPGGLPQLSFGEVVITVHPPVPPPALCEHSEEAARAAVVAVKEAVRATVNSALRSPVDDLPLARPAAAAGEKKDR